MNIQTELRLSFYKEIAEINKSHKIKLVQHIETGKIFVLKELYIYSTQVFNYILDNPSKGIPKIEEIIEDNNILYVIEEYISGNTLREIIDTKGPLEENEAIDYIIQLCDILSPLHKLSPEIVHRDIKPSNIIISSDGTVYLVDFNSAKELKSNQSDDTVLIGTIGYAAPEQYGFSVATPSVDIFAIGVVLNELLTGCLPKEKLYSGSLKNVILKCIEMDPKNRFSSVNEIIKAIKKVHFKIPVNTSSNSSNSSNFKDYLPPGFRTKNPAIIIVASLWYIFFFALSITLELVGIHPKEELILNRITVFSIFLLETLWIGNYRNIWSYMPFSKSSNIIIKIIGIALWTFLIFIMPIIILTILVAILL